MSDAPEPARAIEVLTEGDPPRVWSFIVTLFGDLAQGDGDKMSGRLLARMAEIAGLRPETVRVALHRLRKDGWIDSHRNGRRSLYALTDFGRGQSAAAATRIYAPRAPDPDSCTVLIADPNGAEDALADVASRTDAVPLASFALLVPAPVDSVEPGLLHLRAESARLPDWVRLRACPDDLAAAYDRLFARLRCVKRLAAPEAASLEGAVVRALVVHSWRRVLLRHPDLPAALYPADCKAGACRAAVMDLLVRLPRVPLDRLEAEAAD